MSDMAFGTFFDLILSGEVLMYQNCSLFLCHRKALIKKMKYPDGKKIIAPGTVIVSAGGEVSDVLLDGCQLVFGHVACQHIHLGSADGGAVALRDDLDALGGGVGPLVVKSSSKKYGNGKNNLAVTLPVKFVA